MLPGCIEHMFIHWHIQEKPEAKADVLGRLDAIMDVILEGVRSRRAPQELVIRIDLPATVKFREERRPGTKKDAAPKKKKTE